MGGGFAHGYINGGTTCGWSGKDPWRLWGAAADVDSGEISNAFNSEAFAMKGRAELGFDMAGNQEKLEGALDLKSLSTGLIQIRSLQSLLDRIQKNTEGVKREFMKAFVESLKEYPYRNYALAIHYSKPNATLHFHSESEQGNRALELNWHGKRSQKDEGGEEKEKGRKIVQKAE